MKIAGATTTHHTRKYLTALSRKWLTYSLNYIHPNPDPNSNPTKRNQPMQGGTPFVSYTVCVNHRLQKVVSSAQGNGASRIHLVCNHRARLSTRHRHGHWLSASYNKFVLTMDKTNPNPSPNPYGNTGRSAPLRRH